MTRDEILKMTEQELNDAVAVHVMGWDIKRQEYLQFAEYFNPAENIADAWLVVDVFPTITVGKDPPMYGVDQPACTCPICRGE